MQEDKVIKKLLEHDEQFRKIDQLFSDLEGNLENKFNSRFDQIMVILQRIDQERIFTQAAIRRIEDEQTDHRKQLKQIKKILKIA